MSKRATQDAAELDEFIALLRAEDVRSFGEVGAFTGETFLRIMMSLPRGAKGVALDMPNRNGVRLKTEAALRSVVSALRSEGYDASLIIGDSHAVASQRLFRGRGPYDALLIDADHRLEAVTADWNDYRATARIVALHDIAGPRPDNPKGASVQVPLLWKAIKQQGYRVREIVTPGSGMGIGVVWP